MKKIILGLGGLLFFINTAMGLIFTAYNPLNIVMADVSIILSTTLIYTLYRSAIADGFKIGFTIFFVIAGLIRFICAVVSEEQFNNNFALLTFIAFLGLEGLLLFSAIGLKNK